ncbi:MAG: hypothetical protein JXA22_04270 [Candidatus Thermoplasmatota archaeon]|nr:hypothetical protein [Candidatus Thermoplasmatota archaeon]
MDSKSAVMSIIAIKPQSIGELLNRLPFAPPTIYEAVRDLEEKNLLRRKDALVLVADGFKAKKIADIHILSLSHGIDPEFIMKESTLSIWKTLEVERGYKDVKDLTGYSLVTIKNIISHLVEIGLVKFMRRKPVIAVRKDDHPINKELQMLFSREENGETYHYPGTIPFKENYVTPDELQKILFNRIGEGISVKNTGFLVKNGKGTVSIMESTDEVPSLEELFLKKLLTTEGIEDLCIKILKTGELDLEGLLELSVEKKMTSVVGCYLDILKDIDQEIVSDEIIEKFFGLSQMEKKRTFLKQERSYGKSGWERKYEKKWNIDLYLDLDAIRHGVRSA